MNFALITGASKGIGRALAFELASRHHPLLLVARSENLLEALSIQLKQHFGVAVYWFKADLSEADGPQQVCQWTVSQGYAVTILINNAGYGVWGKFADTNFSEQFRMNELNALALVRLTHLFLPVLRIQPEAFILNVSSTTAYITVPGMTLYSAGKAFVLAFSRGLSHELKSTSVSVSCVCPGGTRTSFLDSAGMAGLTQKPQPFDMNPETLARIAIAGMFKGKREIVPGIAAKLTAVASRWLPKKLLEKVAARLFSN